MGGTTHRALHHSPMCRQLVFFMISSLPPQSVSLIEGCYSRRLGLRMCVLYDFSVFVFRSHHSNVRFGSRSPLVGGWFWVVPRLVLRLIPAWVWLYILRVHTVTSGWMLFRRILSCPRLLPHHPRRCRRHHRCGWVGDRLSAKMLFVRWNQAATPARTSSRTALHV